MEALPTQIIRTMGFLVQFGSDWVENWWET